MAYKYFSETKAKMSLGSHFGFSSSLIVRVLPHLA